MVGGFVGADSPNALCAILAEDKLPKFDGDQL